MRRFLCLAGLVVLALACPVAGGDKGTKITLDGMSSTTPAAWVKETPSGTLRHAQFKVPRAKGDEQDADLAIFKGLGGTVDQNLARWKGQFTPPRGKSIDDVTTVKKIKVGGHEATYVEIQGTYSSALHPKFKGKKWENFRLLAVQFSGADDPYQILLTGPAKTVEENRKAFEDWLKGFKK